MINLIPTEDLISLALLAYLSVLWVSSYDLDEGLTLAIITVLQLPPKESLRSRVSLLSLYGIWVFLPWNKWEKFTLAQEIRPFWMFGFTESVHKKATQKLWKTLGVPLGLLRKDIKRKLERNTCRLWESTTSIKHDTNHNYRKKKCVIAVVCRRAQMWGAP